jgi:hypothetical protein
MTNAGRHLRIAAVISALPLWAHAEPIELERWNAHFQATAIGQWKPAFSADYSGKHSLSPRSERSYSVTCYQMNPLAALSLTLDYQLITAPGYNAARGPVNVVSARIHTQF